MWLEGKAKISRVCNLQVAGPGARVGCLSSIDQATSTVAHFLANKEIQPHLMSLKVNGSESRVLANLSCKGTLTAKGL